MGVLRCMWGPPGLRSRRREEAWPGGGDTPRC
jgi:hypothetical protein